MERTVIHRKCDVLVIGACYAGMWAARKLAQQGMSVVMLEKSVAGSGGCARFAGGDVQCWLGGEDDLEKQVDVMRGLGCGLNREKWLRHAFEISGRLMEEQMALGIPFARDESGALKCKSGRGGIRSIMLNPGEALKILRAECLRAGVTICDRTPAVRLIRDGDGAVLGAVGLEVRSGAWVCCYAKRTVIASGGCGFKGAYFGLDMATGDGPAMALETGAKLMNMEFSNKIQTTHKDFDICGMNYLVAQGGVFRNAEGRRFMSDYEPKLKDGASLVGVAKAFCAEQEAGGAPLYFDLRGMPDGKKAGVRELMEPLAELIDHCGVDFYGEPQEWMACFTGSVGATSAGIWINERYETSLKGLYAIGDAASKAAQLGACVGIGGAGMLFALVSAEDVCGELSKAGGGPAAAGPEAVLEEALLAGLEGMWRRGTGRCEDTLYGLQEVLFDLGCSFLKEERVLRQAIGRVKKLLAESDDWHYADTHGYMKCWETRHMLENGLAFLAASLARRESRGGHLRIDYPQTRPEYEACSVVGLGRDGELEVSGFSEGRQEKE